MNSELEDEIQVLEAIFGSESISHQVIFTDHHAPTTSSGTDGTTSRGSCTALVEVTYSCAEGGFALRFRCPHEYPSSAEPVVSVSFANRQSAALTSLIHRRVEALLKAHAGEVVMHSVIELVRSTVQDEADGTLQVSEVIEGDNDEEAVGSVYDGDEGRERGEGAVMNLWDDEEAGEDGRSTASAAYGVSSKHSWKGEHRLGAEEDEDSIEIVHGEPMTERASVFQCHFARVRSLDDVARFRRVLLLDKKIARATHNIFAYRFSDPVTGVVYHDCDDDGECAAGGRLAEILRLMQADGIAVTVSRWFGGVLLGPSRFRLINNCARRLLEDRARDCIMGGLSAGQGGANNGSGRGGGGGGGEDSHGKQTGKKR